MPRTTASVDDMATARAIASDVLLRLDGHLDR
jgi:hypothetical protein